MTNTSKRNTEYTPDNAESDTIKIFGQFQHQEFKPWLM